MRVFVSREPSQNEALRTLEELPGVEWIEQSLIQIQAVPFDLPSPLPKWCFFSSPNAARTFFQSADKLDASIAVMGEGTAKAIPPSHPIAFIGDGSTQDVARTFSTVLGNDQVLFPIGNRSNRTVQTSLPADQVIDLQCYSTELTSSSIPKCDVYFFTSPSNVESFAASNRFQPSALHLAMGELTRKALEKLGVNAIMPENYSSQACWNAIFSRFHS